MMEAERAPRSTVSSSGLRVPANFATTAMPYGLAFHHSSELPVAVRHVNWPGRLSATRPRPRNCRAHDRQDRHGRTVIRAGIVNHRTTPPRHGAAVTSMTASDVALVSTRNVAPCKPQRIGRSPFGPGCTTSETAQRASKRRAAEMLGTDLASRRQPQRQAGRHHF
jgi:hypothetical protein